MNASHTHTPPTITETPDTAGYYGRRARGARTQQIRRGDVFPRHGRPIWQLLAVQRPERAVERIVPQPQSKGNNPQNIRNQPISVRRRRSVWLHLSL